MANLAHIQASAFNDQLTIEISHKSFEIHVLRSSSSHNASPFERREKIQNVSVHKSLKSAREAA